MASRSSATRRLVVGGLLAVLTASCAPSTEFSPLAFELVGADCGMAVYGRECTLDLGVQPAQGSTDLVLRSSDDRDITVTFIHSTPSTDVLEFDESVLVPSHGTASLGVAWDVEASSDYEATCQVVAEAVEAGAFVQDEWALVIRLVPEGQM